MANKALPILAAGAAAIFLFGGKKKTKKAGASNSETKTIPEIRGPGLWFNKDCTNFVLVPGPNTEHGKIYEDSLSSAIETAKIKGSKFDPYEVAARTLNKISECKLFPTPNSPDRIAQLYIYFTILMGTSAAQDGLEVDGETNPSKIETLIIKRFVEMGYPQFDPAVIPEMAEEYFDPNPNN